MSTRPPSLRIERLHQPSAEDRAALLALEAASFTNPWSADTFDVMMQSPVTQLWVGRDGEEIIAFCACYVFGTERVDINTVAVEVSRRRQGIARALLEHILAATGVRAATLDVRVSNIAAIQLYQGLGFTVTHTRPGYYENPDEDGLILWLDP
ncbi:MAG: ribosomal protein S18-alanine N-acetyltransferase [Acidobacteria bacterium]|nr:ribosomal protein S18-alanine N-acetyltransferase [Acidobacteriota bacterium]